MRPACVHVWQHRKETGPSHRSRRSTCQGLFCPLACQHVFRSPTVLDGRGLAGWLGWCSWDTTNPRPTSARRFFLEYVGVGRFIRDILRLEGLYIQSCKWGRRSRFLFGEQSLLADVVMSLAMARGYPDLRWLLRHQALLRRLYSVLLVCKPRGSIFFVFFSLPLPGNIAHLFCYSVPFSRCCPMP